MAPGETRRTRTGPAGRWERRHSGEGERLGAQAMLAAIVAAHRASGARGWGEERRGLVEEVEGTEEDWLRRHCKRRGAVATIQRTAAYIAFSHDREVGDYIPDFRPTTPDAEDRSISKRMWEATVANWRTDLRPWAPLLVDAPLPVLHVGPIEAELN